MLNVRLFTTGFWSQAQLPAQVQRAEPVIMVGLQGQPDSYLLPFPLNSALFLFICAVAMTEYGNMFISLLHQTM